MTTFTVINTKIYFYDTTNFKRIEIKMQYKLTISYSPVSLSRVSSPSISSINLSLSALPFSTASTSFSEFLKFLIFLIFPTGEICSGADSLRLSVSFTIFLMLFLMMIYPVRFYRNSSPFYILHKFTIISYSGIDTRNISCVLSLIYAKGIVFAEVE